MTIYGLYMDESGNTGINDPNQPVLVYTGVLIPKNAKNHFEQEMISVIENVKTRIQKEVLGVPKDCFKDISFFSKFELHAKELMDGDDFYSKLNFADRIQVFIDVYDIVKKYGVEILCSITNKIMYQSKNSGSTSPKILGHQMHEQGLRALINQANSFLSAEDAYSFIVADNGKPYELDLLQGVLRQQTGDYRVYPDLQIKDSHCSAAIQASDLICFVTTVMFRNNYGITTRKHNGAIVQLYQDHLAGSVTFWEYN